MTSSSSKYYQVEITEHKGTDTKLLFLSSECLWDELKITYGTNTRSYGALHPDNDFQSELLSLLLTYKECIKTQPTLVSTRTNRDGRPQ